jgi:hypothetical protein
MLLFSSFNPEEPFKVILQPFVPTYSSMNLTMRGYVCLLIISYCCSEVPELAIDTPLVVAHYA